jgi:hypothetical protein
MVQRAEQDRGVTKVSDPLPITPGYQPPELQGSGMELARRGPLPKGFRAPRMSVFGNEFDPFEPGQGRRARAGVTKISAGKGQQWLVS